MMLDTVPVWGAVVVASAYLFVIATATIVALVARSPIRREAARILLTTLLRSTRPRNSLGQTDPDRHDDDQAHIAADHQSPPAP
jgi:hypothetical protein